MLVYQRVVCISLPTFKEIQHDSTIRTWNLNPTIMIRNHSDFLGPCSNLNLNPFPDMDPVMIQFRHCH